MALTQLRLLAAAAALLGLAACETGPTPEELQAADLAACDAAGFETGSDSHGLCLLLQTTNRRLTSLERRLNFLELDVRSFGRFGYCRDRNC
jgi:hypothetical protein